MRLLFTILFLFVVSPVWAAFPQVAASGGAGDATAVTDHPITLPANIDAGNLLLMFISCRNADGTLTQPDGWNVLVNDTFGTGSSSIRGALFSRIADGGEGATATAVTSAARICAWVSVRITGHDAGSAPESSAKVEGTGTSADPGTLTPSWGAADTLWIAWASWTTSSAVNAYPANYTSNQLTQVGTGTTSRIVISSRELNATSEDPGAYTIAASNNFVTFTTAVKPPTAATRRPISPMVFQ